MAGTELIQRNVGSASAAELLVAKLRLTTKKALSAPFPLSDPGRIRTYNQMIKSHLRYHCATGPFPPLYEAVRLLTIRSERKMS